MPDKFFLFNVLVIFLLGAAYTYFFGYQNNVENFLYSMSYRPESMNTDDIVIIDLDDRTLQKVGRWPIPRDYYRKILEKVSRSDAIVFDIIFSEASTGDSLVLPLLDSLSEKIVMPIVINDTQIIWPNHSMLKRIRYLGTSSIIVENNGFVFRVPSIEKAGRMMVYSISILAAYIHSGIEPYTIVKKYGDELYFSIPLQKPRKISAWDFVNSRDTFSLENKIVFIGSSAIGVGDFFTLPDGQIVPGVEVHSYVTASILNDKIKKLADPVKMLIIYLLLSIMLLLIFNELPFIIWFPVALIYAISIIVVQRINIEKDLLTPAFFFLLPIIYIFPAYTVRFHIKILNRSLDMFRRLAERIALEEEIPDRFPSTKDIYTMDYQDLMENMQYISDYINKEIHLISKLSDTLNVGIMIENRSGKVLYMNRFFRSVAPDKEDLSRDQMEKDGRFFKVERFDFEHFRIYTIADVTHQERQARDYHLLFRMLNHEIRTPLNIVIGYWDILKVKGKLDGEAMQKIDKAIETILTILDNFTIIAKSRAGLINTIRERVDISQTIRELLERLQSSYPRPLDIELRCEGMTVETDPILVRIILKNLLENALKYAESRIIVECTGNTISVANDTNITAREIHALSEPFHRGSNVMGRKGIGLGMTIIRELVNALGIEMKIEDAPDVGGIRITLRFPESSEQPETVQP